MTLDSSRPVHYRISIDSAGLGGAAPADGFIDPTIIEKYMSIYTLTGTVNAPVVNDNDYIYINGVNVTFLTGATDLTGMIASINALSEHHHVVASSVAGPKLSLTNEHGFEGNPITVTGPEQTLIDIGYVAPTLATIPGALPASLANARAKARANIRWKMIVEQISRDSSPIGVVSINKTGGTVDAAPSVVAFTLIHSASYLAHTLDEYNSYIDMDGILAIKRMVARALMMAKSQLFSVMDPTVDGDGFVLGGRIENIQVGALTADLGDAEDAVTVTIISNTR